MNEIEKPTPDQAIKTDRAARRAAEERRIAAELLTSALSYLQKSGTKIEAANQPKSENQPAKLLLTFDRLRYVVGSGGAKVVVEVEDE
jgi:hypothetical protein